jgi:hypothetical protein
MISKLISKSDFADFVKKGYPEKKISYYCGLGSIDFDEVKMVFGGEIPSTYK